MTFLPTPQPQTAPGQQSNGVGSIAGPSWDFSYSGGNQRNSRVQLNLGKVMENGILASIPCLQCPGPLPLVMTDYDRAC